MIFLGIVVGILAVNHVVLLAIPLLIRNVAVPVLVVIQEIFSLLPVTLGARMVPTGLKGYGVISLH